MAIKSGTYPTQQSVRPDVENTSVKQDPLQAAMLRLGHSLAERAAQRAGDEQQLHLPLEERGDRPATQRTLFFDQSYCATRRYFENRQLRLATGQPVIYRGEQLLNDDRAVWEQMLYCYQRQSRDDWIQFSPRTFLKSIGWGVSAHDQSRLRDCLERMQATVIKLSTSNDDMPAYSLISKCQWEPSPGGFSGRWRVWIDTEVRRLFADDGLSRTRHLAA